MSYAQQKARGVANPELIPHGTNSGYTSWGCRCPGCLDATEIEYAGFARNQRVALRVADTLRVSRTTPYLALATSITKALRKAESVVIECIGVDANYTTVKALIMARLFLAKEGLDCVVRPDFKDVVVGDVGLLGEFLSAEERTAMRYHVERATQTG